MFKNAGTTLDWSLQRCFGEGFVDHRDDDAMRKPDDYLPTYLENHTQLRALSSHWLPLPVQETPNITPHVIMLFRHPIERCRSVYNFERTQRGSNSPGNQKARSLSFVDYVKWRLQPGTGPALRNFHTRYCSGDYFGTEIDRLHEQAMSNLESIPLLGLVHRYAGSMVLFEEGLSPAFPDLDLSWRVQNASQLASSTLEDRIEGIAAELGDTFAALVDANKYDLMLLQHVEDKLSKALSKLPNLDAQLSSMHQRNELLK